MIKLICPRCMKPVPVADDFSGREVTCPACMKSFDAPARYNPEVLAEAPPAAPVPAAPPPVPPAPPPESAASQPAPLPPARPSRPSEPSMSSDVPPDRPAPPPGFIVPPPPTPAPAAVAVAPPPQPVAPVTPPAPPPEGGYTHARGITISPRVVAWLPAVLLAVTFLCTFFPWVGSYRGGHPVYSQSPWRAVFSNVNRNFKLEQQGTGVWLDKVTSDWMLLVPFVLFLAVATVFAFADRGLQTFDPRKVPPLAKLWPWRKTVIGVAGGIAFLLIAAQVARGFGMERAIRAAVREDPVIAKAREEAKGSAAKEAAVDDREEDEVRNYNLERTLWQDLALACNLGAVLAVILSVRLDKRGNKPPPKILLHY